MRGSASGGEIESGVDVDVMEEDGRGDRDRFITYWTEKGTGRPVRWVFFNDAYFEVCGDGNQGRVFFAYLAPTHHASASALA